LPDVGAGPEEADAADDLRGDARRVGADEAAAACEELVEAVGGDEREERRPDADDEVRAKASLPLAPLALHADRAAERSRDRQPQEHVRPLERRDDAKEVQGPPLPPAARRSWRWRPHPLRADRRAWRARTDPSPPSPAPRSGGRRRS